MNDAIIKEVVDVLRKKSVETRLKLDTAKVPMPFLTPKCAREIAYRIVELFDTTEIERFFIDPPPKSRKVVRAKVVKKGKGPIIIGPLGVDD